MHVCGPALIVEVPCRACRVCVCVWCVCVGGGLVCGLVGWWVGEWVSG